MPDMLVKLYELPPLAPALKRVEVAGIAVRPALAAEKRFVVAWVEDTFSDYWASECEVAFGRDPIACHVAIREGKILGIACYNTTARNFFGPTGVDESARGLGIGKALLLSCLYLMAAQGYAYAIIGGVGPTAFYETAVGAIPIPDSDPGIYRDMLLP